MRPVIGITCSLGGETLGGTSYFLERNIVGLGYVRAIEHVGGTPIALPHVRESACLDGYLGLLDGLLLPGGGDIDPLLFGQEPHPQLGGVDRQRDDLELELTRKALEQDMPIFGICRGSQILNVAAGGTLYQDIAAEMPQPTLSHNQKGAGWYASHTIDIVPDSQMHRIIGATTARVNSFHHQAIRDVPEGFVATAHAKDSVIEAIESRTHRFALGVEYHPELMWERHPEALNLFVAFIKACQ
jgi:putative glutamine amidotransferase